MGGAATQLPATRPAAAMYLDPSGDDVLTARDVLDVIDEINRGAGAGEGEVAVVPSADWWAAPSPNAESRSPRSRICSNGHSGA